jgi:hypothetical protein
MAWVPLRRVSSRWHAVQRVWAWRPSSGHAVRSVWSKRSIANSVVEWHSSQVRTGAVRRNWPAWGSSWHPAQSRGAPRKLAPRPERRSAAGAVWQALHCALA